MRNYCNDRALMVIVSTSERVVEKILRIKKIFLAHGPRFGV
jgi:hypothetical protein